MSKDLLQFFINQKYEELAMPEHLAQSNQCCFSDLIFQTAQNIFQMSDSAEKKARVAYEFVRNQILYSFEPWEDSSETTLKKKLGNCFHKSNVMIALLRSQNIPCVFSAVSIHKKTFAWFVPKQTFETLSSNSLHVYVEAFLGGEWRRYVDTSLDRTLRKNVTAAGVDPFDCLLTDQPIKRFFFPEEIVNYMRRQNPPLALSQLDENLILHIRNAFEEFRKK